MISTVSMEFEPLDIINGECLRYTADVEVFIEEQIPNHNELGQVEATAVTAVVEKITINKDGFSPMDEEQFLQTFPDCAESLEFARHEAVEML